VVDSSHRVVVGQTDYLSDGAVDLTFAGAFAGEAYLNRWRTRATQWLP
jgi:hypothetical protein